jgi:hypothetical protein
MLSMPGIWAINISATKVFELTKLGYSENFLPAVMPKKILSSN